MAQAQQRKKQWTKPEIHSYASIDEAPAKYRSALERLKRLKGLQTSPEQIEFERRQRFARK